MLEKKRRKYKEKKIWFILKRKKNFRDTDLFILINYLIRQLPYIFILFFLKFILNLKFKVDNKIFVV